MKRIKGVICHVEHVFMDFVNPIANAAIRAASMKAIDERRQAHGISYWIISTCAASVGRKGLTNAEAASRNRDVFYKDFLGQRVVPYTSNISPGPQGHFGNHNKFESDLSLPEGRKQRLGYYSQWQRACFVSDNQDYCGGRYLSAYC